MSTRYSKLFAAFAATLSLVPTVSAAPIPISSPTAIALIIYLSVVPMSLILLLIFKYFYVKTRKADAASGQTLSNSPPFQLRMRYRLGCCVERSNWSVSRTAFFVGLLGSPDWEIKVKASDHSTIVDTHSQFSYAAHPCSKPDPLGYTSLGSFLLGAARAPTPPVSGTDSVCSISWDELGLRGYGFRPSPTLRPQTNPSSTLWTPLPPPPKAR